MAQTVQSNDPPLRSTVEDTIADCRKFRILVLGKAGCGKSSLINQVFGVKDLAKVAHHGSIGKANINKELFHDDNDRFILHDSEGFEPGEDLKFNTAKRFIEERSKKEKLEDRLHAIWICISAPIAGDRVAETGVEKIVKMDRRGVPLVVVFTKYDYLVSNEIKGSGVAWSKVQKEAMWSYGEKKAIEAFERLCATPLTKIIGEVPIMKASIKPRFMDTIQQLIAVTDKAVQRHMQVSSHTEPAPLAWAVAQRANSDVKIEASIDVGRKSMCTPFSCYLVLAHTRVCILSEYWSGLLVSTDSEGKKLQQCLEVIHYDIVAVWNIRCSNYLDGADFRTKMCVLIDDLVTNPTTPKSHGLDLTVVAAIAGATATTTGIFILAIGTATIFAKWIHDVYARTPYNIACIMGYIVDLTILMHKLSVESDVSEERATSVFQTYAKSEKIVLVHNDIRKFVNQISAKKIVNVDYTFNEITRLIEKHCINHEGKVW